MWTAIRTIRPALKIKAFESKPKPMGFAATWFQRPGGQKESTKATKQGKRTIHLVYSNDMLPSPAFTRNIATLHCWLVVVPCFSKRETVKSSKCRKIWKLNSSSAGWTKSPPPPKKNRSPLGVTIPKLSLREKFSSMEDCHLAY